jgi:hypothetical protein
MIESNLDTAHSILHIRAKSALQENDFVKLAQEVDPYIRVSGRLAGVIVEAPKFPGWDSLGAMRAHFRFVKDHHKRIDKVAVVTDSKLGGVAETLGSRLISPQIKHYPAGDLEAAKRWVEGMQ